MPNYTCEICGKVFDRALACELHEAQHAALSLQKELAAYVTAAQAAEPYKTDPLATVRREAVEDTALIRFWGMVEKTDDCWLWKGAVSMAGYGRFWNDGRMCQASRFSYELVHGKIPKGKEACHRCDTPACVNPEHIFIGTHRENLLDASAKGRIGKPSERLTHCKRGHPFAGDNLRVLPNGKYRVCKECHKMNDRRYKSAKRKRLCCERGVEIEAERR